jgi:uncharacterized protein YbaP (TraB family)
MIFWEQVMKCYRRLSMVLFFVCFGSLATPSKSVSPLFWQLQYQGKTSYAFGSIHLGEKAMYPLPEKVMAGFESSDKLAVEIDLAKLNQSTIMQLTQHYGIDVKRPLKSWLTTDVQKQYQQYCQQRQLSCERFASFKPWLVSMTLMSVNFMQSGFNAELGIDKFFVTKASDKKPIVALETIDQQLALLSNLSKRIQQELLVQSMLSEIVDLKDMMNGWYRGDEAKLITLFTKTSDSELKQVFTQKMLVERNIAMVDKLMAELKTGSSMFIVVGTAHLIGDSNMLQLMRQQGVKISKL